MTGGLLKECRGRLARESRGHLALAELQSLRGRDGRVTRGQDARDTLIALTIMLAAGALGGCQSQPLSMELSTYTPALCVTYSLQESGQLTINMDGGYGGAGRSRQLYDCQLDQAAMTRLKNVVTSSGVLLASSLGEGLMSESSGEGMGIGPAVRAVIKLGLWENKLETHGESLPSLQKVIDELNAHLPRQYWFLYGSRTVGQEAKQQESVWR